MDSERVALLVIANGRPQWQAIAAFDGYRVIVSAEWIQLGPRLVVFFNRKNEGAGLTLQVVPPGQHVLDTSWEGGDLYKITNQTIIDAFLDRIARVDPVYRHIS